MAIADNDQNETRVYCAPMRRGGPLVILVLAVVACSGGSDTSPATTEGPVPETAPPSTEPPATTTTTSTSTTTTTTTVPPSTTTVPPTTTAPQEQPPVSGPPPTPEADVFYAEAFEVYRQGWLALNEAYRDPTNQERRDALEEFFLPESLEIFNTDLNQVNDRNLRNVDRGDNTQNLKFVSGFAATADGSAITIVVCATRTDITVDTATESTVFDNVQSVISEVQLRSDGQGQLKIFGRLALDTFEGTECTT